MPSLDKEQLPVGVGDREAQARFIASNRDFLLEHPPLHGLLQKVVLRQLPSPSQGELDHLLTLPENDPAVVAFENKVMADRIVFGLGRVIVDDFGEILTLAGNGRGVGANKILRGMYESLVTAAYIAKNPLEARPFAEDDAIKKWKLWERMVEFSPEIKNSLPAEKIAELEADYKRAKANRPKGQKEWTSVNLPDRAKMVDKNLYGFYGPCYLEPTFHAHATASGLGLRFLRTEDGSNSYKEMTEKEARKALQLAHALVLNFLDLSASSEMLACSVGDSPTGEKVRDPVAWVAFVEETKRMKPTDKAILGMVSESPGRNVSEPRSGLDKI